MKLVLRSVLFQVMCVLLFSALYYKFQDPTSLDTTMNYSDALLLSVTIQSGVGIAYIIPQSYICKVLMIIQQFIMLLSYIFILYIFTL